MLRKKVYHVGVEVIICNKLGLLVRLLAKNFQFLGIILAKLKQIRVSSTQLSNHMFG